MPLDLVIDPRAIAAALVLLAIFLILYLTFSGFNMVGITPGEVVVLLFLAPFMAQISLPLFTMQGVVVGFNLAGALVPVGLSIRFITKDRMPVWKTVAGTAAVTAVGFMVARITDRGIVVPAFLLVATALIMGVALAGHKHKQVGPLTYASGALGTLVGADLLHLQEIVAHIAQVSAQDRPAAVIGGAGTLDAIYLVGLVAVLGGIGTVATQRLWGTLREA